MTEGYPRNEDARECPDVLPIKCSNRLALFSLRVAGPRETGKSGFSLLFVLAQQFCGVKQMELRR